MSSDIVLVLDNIRSLYNVGSMFRTADGFGVSKIYLCGITGTPEQHGVQKVALGAEQSVAWEHAAQTWRVVEDLKKRGFMTVGLERSDESVDLSLFAPKFPLAMVVGNEIRGLTPALRKRLDAVIHIPMSGMKESFNVAVACGIALFAIKAKAHR